MGTVTAIGEGPGFPDRFDGGGSDVRGGDRMAGLGLASRGSTAYLAHWNEADGRPAGCAFVDRHQAEQAADARSGGWFYRYAGLDGWSAEPVLEATPEPTPPRGPRSGRTCPTPARNRRQ
jgi:hypothetical protein